jgi:cytochrome c-type biogenesis protein CcmF
MIPELGHFALILALGVSLLQVALPLYGWQRKDARALASATSTTLTQGVLILIAFSCLTWAFVQKDFSVVYVAANSHSQLPLIYRMTAVWGAHEGSLLLWVLMLSGWSCAVALTNRRLPRELAALVLSVLGMISVGFLLFMLLTSNPFERHFPVPLEGRDLNPLLQDPGMVIHPPMLYMGYVGFSVAFAFAIAALLTGRLDSAWVRWTRPWTTGAWMFLTMGITLGSWWAYNELGWGGWWFWDPVENASFMPWLVGTALIHSLAVTEKRGLLKAWTVLLAIFAFGLSLLGTFLVRSGVLVSVHAFATDPARGIFVLAFLATVVGGALTLFAWRAPKLVSEGELNLLSREGLLLLNNVFLVVAAVTVLIGTLYPLILDATSLGKISVGPPYFNSVFLPLIAPLMLLVGFASATAWKRAQPAAILRRLRLPAVVALLAAAMMPWLFEHKVAMLATVGSGLSLWIFSTAFQEPWRRLRAKTSVPRAIWGMSLAHFGLGLWTLGVAFVSSYSVERDVRLGAGGAAELGGYQFIFKSVEQYSGPNFNADRATMTVERNGRPVAELHPEKRLYPSQGSVMTEAAVDHNPRRDLYVALGEGFDDGEWSFRLYYKPMIRLIWGGGVFMFFGGLLAATDRRYRLARKSEAPAAILAEAVK